MKNDHFLHGILEKFFRSRFATISAALHFLFIVTFGGTVLFQHNGKPSKDMDSAYGDSFLSEEQLVERPPERDSRDPASPPRPSERHPVTGPAEPVVVAILQTRRESPLDFPRSRMFSPPGPALPEAPDRPPPGPRDGATLSPSDLKAIEELTGSWRTGGPRGSKFSDQSTFEFSVFLAKYAGGNWDSTVEVRNGEIVKGSLPNLMYVMKAWTQNRVDAGAEVKPLDLASDDLFRVKPPFILFTGHQDFVLTDEEVANLRRYLMMGGAIWGDSSLPGHRSRFDIAFRREMERVLPDDDKEFERLPAGHPVFEQGYFSQISEVPAGMNYYQEPVYVMRMHGEIAVIYTPNDYADLWQIGLTKDGQIDTRRDERNRYVALNASIWSQRDIYFRNVNQKSVQESYRFGINMVLHLVTRWERHLMQSSPRF